jgi:hypothetical protein
MLGNSIKIKHIIKNISCILIRKSKYTLIVELKISLCFGISLYYHPGIANLFLPIRHVLKSLFYKHSSSALSWPTFYDRDKISDRAIQNELVGCVQPVGHMFETPVLVSTC